MPGCDNVGCAESLQPQGHPACDRSPVPPGAGLALHVLLIWRVGLGNVCPGASLEPQEGMQKCHLS